jgi:hypothetical protein
MRYGSLHTLAPDAVAVEVHATPTR